MARVCCSWRPDELWHQHYGRVSPSWHLRRPDSQGRETRRPAGFAADQVRAGNQPEDRQGARPNNSAECTSHCRRGDRVRRREFITLLGGAAAWRLAARAQQGERMRRIGVLMPFAEGDPEGLVRSVALQQGLEKLGWTIGRNVQIDYHWGIRDVEKAQAAIAELLALAPDVIIASTSQTVAALQQTTVTVPIVFTGTYEPVAQGFVRSLAHPGGNITGFTNVEATIGAKW